ncbi:DISARM system phospholipase D-like protein DrmC [Congregibacter litoralis]|uniref:DISARM system phospholipase D-like protein DrmC n=1 Tax=Congregibacter litoralis TaxID=393662 RepID=UPI00006B5EC7|nr:DISARM system phospholipase D-like protein DrmC [Congregibacter litoralis]
MDKLLDAICRLVSNQHPNQIRALANKARTLSSTDAGRLAGFFNSQAANHVLSEVVEEWRQAACSGAEFAGLLVGASHGHMSEKARENIELVWSGPDTHHVPVRRSEQVYIELIESAAESLFIGSYVWVNIPKIETAIRDAIERGVDVRMLLESSDKDGGTFFRDTVKRVAKELVGATIYVWPLENRDSGAGGFPSMHAKCVVADGERAFLTSANLTSAAMDKNIETGVLAYGGIVPGMLSRQLLNMITQGDIQAYSQAAYAPPAADSGPKVIDIKELDQNRQYSGSLLIGYRNEKLEVDETRTFRVLAEDDELPPKGALVIILGDKPLVGRYLWQKQQSMNGERTYYSVTMRGQGSHNAIEVEEINWPMFRPFAVDVS